MRRLTWLCAAGALAALCADAGNDTHNVNFVNALKRNLQKNNDDYAETERPPAGSPRAPPAATAPLLHPPANVTTTLLSGGNGDNRRAAGALSWQVDYETTQRHPAAPASPPAAPALSSDKPARSRFLHVRRNISRLQPQLQRPHAGVANNTLRFKNETRISKYKHFMKKNKELVGRVRGNDVRTGEEEYKLKEILEKGSARSELAADPALLDMAPARGGRVHRLRDKGRLCQRHVLLPEGPKYDSVGRWYVPEHRLVARHRYDRTPRPGLLLPRCCNCCKKSVLGCE